MSSNNPSTGTTKEKQRQTQTRRRCLTGPSSPPAASAPCLGQEARAPSHSSALVSVRRVHCRVLPSAHGRATRSATATPRGAAVTRRPSCCASPRPRPSSVRTDRFSRQFNSTPEARPDAAQRPGSTAANASGHEAGLLPLELGVRTRASGAKHPRPPPRMVPARRPAPFGGRRGWKRAPRPVRSELGADGFSGALAACRSSGIV